MAQKIVALAMPRYARSVACADAAHAFYRASKRNDVTRLELRKATSLAIRCFNLMWCDALNSRQKYGITHFAMQHDDVAPDEGWLDVLLDELTASGADMLSAVVPIKNGCGCTSTAVDLEGAPWITRRLTMHEVHQLPETFGLADIPWRLPTSQLVVNSGLWVCDFTKPWVEQVCFGDQTRIIQLPDGEFACEDISEDWDFSRQLNALGLDIRATRKVGLYHERPEFTNREPWGAWQRDEGYFQLLNRGAHLAIPMGPQQWPS
jgi:hypothetical protein